MSWFVCLPLRESGVLAMSWGGMVLPTVGGKAQEGWGWGCIDVQGLLSSSSASCFSGLSFLISVRVKAVTIIWIPSISAAQSELCRQSSLSITEELTYQGSVPGSCRPRAVIRIWRWGSSNQFYQPSRWFQCMLKFETRAWSLWNIRASHWRVQEFL